MEHYDKWGRPLTDNEVTEVAKMQKHIDNLELYFRTLYLTLKGEQPTGSMIEDEKTSQSWEFQEVLEFLNYVRTEYAYVFSAFSERKEQRWQQQRIRQRQATKATKPKPFWKRLCGDFLPLL